MKANEVHKMSDEELKVEDDRLRRRLFELKSQAVTEKLENPRELGEIRRDVARVKTEQRTREIAAIAAAAAAPAAPAEPAQA